MNEEKFIEIAKRISNIHERLNMVEKILESIKSIRQYHTADPEIRFSIKHNYSRVDIKDSISEDSTTVINFFEGLYKLKKSNLLDKLKDLIKDTTP